MMYVWRVSYLGLYLVLLIDSIKANPDVKDAIKSLTPSKQERIASKSGSPKYVSYQSAEEWQTPNYYVNAGDIDSDESDEAAVIIDIYKHPDTSDSINRIRKTLNDQNEKFKRGKLKVLRKKFQKVSKDMIEKSAKALHPSNHDEKELEIQIGVAESPREKEGEKPQLDSDLSAKEKLVLFAVNNKMTSEEVDVDNKKWLLTIEAYKRLGDMTVDNTFAMTSSESGDDNDQHELHEIPLSKDECRDCMGGYGGQNEEDEDSFEFSGESLSESMLNPSVELPDKLKHEHENEIKKVRSVDGKHEAMKHYSTKLAENIVGTLHKGFKYKSDKVKSSEKASKESEQLYIRKQFTENY